MNRNMSGRGGGDHFGRPSSGSAPRSSGSREERDSVPRIDVSVIRFGQQIDPKLYSDIAEEAAKAVADGAGKEKNKPTQLRRFYDELVMLQEKVGKDAGRFEQQAPFIQMLKAKVAYARGRNKVDGNFDRLLRHLIDQAADAGALKQVKLFMEAFMGFYKVHGPSER